MPNLEERSLAHFLSWSVGPVGMKEPGAYGDFFEKFLFNSLNKLKLASAMRWTIWAECAAKPREEVPCQAKHNE